MFSSGRYRSPAPPAYKAGRYYGPVGSNKTASAPNNTPIYAPMVVWRSHTFDRISANVTVAGNAGSTIRLGVYADDGFGVPGALILDAGTADAATTGAKEIIISQALSPGVVWLVLAAQGASTTAPTVRMMANQALFPVGAYNAANAGECGYYGSNVTGALPSTAPVDASSGDAPFIKVRA